jgi:hypothetical protein
MLKHSIRQSEEVTEMDTQEKRTAPPYLSFTTLNTFVDGLAVHMPTRIDKSLMKSMSGASQSALIAALDYFGLRNGDKPSDTLVALASTSGPERAATWKALITKGYAFLFSDGFDLKRATQGELDDKFRAEGVTGETIRKCVAFFMAAAQAAGIDVSPRFRSIKTRTPRTRGASTGAKTKKPKRDEKPKDHQPEDTGPGSSKSAKTIKFANGGTAELRVDVDVVSLSREDRDALFGWIDAMDDYEKKRGSVADTTTPAN